MLRSSFILIEAGVVRQKWVQQDEGILVMHFFHAHKLHLCRIFSTARRASAQSSPSCQKGSGAATRQGNISAKHDEILWK